MYVRNLSGTASEDDVIYTRLKAVCMLETGFLYAAASVSANLRVKYLNPSDG